jgi:hypothetical protein
VLPTTGPRLSFKVSLSERAEFELLAREDRGPGPKAKDGSNQAVNLEHIQFSEGKRKSWCRRGDSNPHELPHTPLKRARLPIPPLRLKDQTAAYRTAIITSTFAVKDLRSLEPGISKNSDHFGLLAGDAVPAGDSEVAGAAVACGVGVGVGEG